jgi:hypothetical protein
MTAKLWIASCIVLGGLVGMVVLMALEIISWDIGGPILTAIIFGALGVLFPSTALTE